jgi:hypothetical protein
MKAAASWQPPMRFGAPGFPARTPTALHSHEGQHHKTRLPFKIASTKKLPNLRVSLTRLINLALYFFNGTKILLDTALICESLIIKGIACWASC